jgi:hypothetical protein
MGRRRSLIDPDSHTPSISPSDHITGKEVHGLETGIQKPSSRKVNSGGTRRAAQWKEIHFEKVTAAARLCGFPKRYGVSEG